MSAGRVKGKRIGAYNLPNEKKRGWPAAARIEADMTIDELASAAEVSARTIKRMEASNIMNRSGYGSRFYPPTPAQLITAALTEKRKPKKK